MNGLLLLARGAEASFILSAYMSTLRNHWSPGPISSFPPCYRLKIPHRHKAPTTKRTFQGAQWCCLRNKSQPETKSISVGCLCLCACRKCHQSWGFFPSPSFCKHYVLNGNHGNKGYEYDKICCILCENLIRIENLKEIVKWIKFN